jgi:hypothetical protein
LSGPERPHCPGDGAAGAGAPRGDQGGDQEGTRFRQDWAWELSFCGPTVPGDHLGKSTLAAQASVSPSAPALLGGELTFFGEGMWDLNSGLCTAKPLLYGSSHTSRPCCTGYFGDGLSGAICPGWPRTAGLLISASQVAGVTGASHGARPRSHFYDGGICTLHTGDGLRATHPSRPPGSWAFTFLFLNYHDGSAHAYTELGASSPFLSPRFQCLLGFWGSSR